ncbi:hypothetical protein WME95_45785 [Sorangium sp. So ce327]|uniref:hypothetical protein n=1 Tax=Sorangium sp. So ce327 TaxID=3133301 RepID=UPI003F60157B
MKLSARLLAGVVLSAQMFSCTVDGDGGECVSPTQNLDTAYEPGSVGCACTDADEDVCVDDSSGRGVALVCDAGRWRAVVDGPCAPPPPVCFSPTQNVDKAYTPGAVGCACADTDQDVCVEDSTGRDVALVCDAGRWKAVEDGPCAPVPPVCFSPTQNLDTAYEPGSVGCACTDADEDVCVDDSTGRGVALVCNDGRWDAVEDGPCAPVPPVCFSPTQNLDTAYEPGSVGCACADTDEDVCVKDSHGRAVALVCEGGAWLAVLDGPCGGG